VKLDPELETRLVSIPVTDSAAQTKAVMYALADDRGQAEIDMQWPTLQQVIADDALHFGTGVHVPFAHPLADAIPPAATRLRRDFGAILALVKTHALLHRATRQRDGDGRTIASIEDYTVVRELVADLVSEGVGRTVSPETRETVQAVERLEPGHENGVMQTALAAELGLDRGTVSRRVRKALDGGYVRNLEEHRGRPHRLLPGDPLPDEHVILPDPEELHGCAVAETPPPGQGGNGLPVVTRRPTTEFKERLERLKAADHMRRLGLDPAEDES
jgi:winged helix-turn-helix DNA-binding protein